jgi:hypothetical protein
MSPKCPGDTVSRLVDVECLVCVEELSLLAGSNVLWSWNLPKPGKGNRGQLNVGVKVLIQEAEPVTGLVRASAGGSLTLCLFLHRSLEAGGGLV